MGEELHRIACANLTFARHCQIKAGPSALQETLDHVVASESDSEFEARHAGLCDLKLGGANPNAIADQGARFEQALRREVLAERSPGKLHLRELLEPERVVFARIDVDSLFRTAVDGQIGLCISCHVELSHGDRSVDRRLPDRSLYQTSMPLDFARKAGVDGDQLHRSRSTPTSRRSRHCLST